MQEIMKILVFANNDIGLYKFRKELLSELIDKKNTIFIALPKGEYVKKLIELGCQYIESDVDRRGTSIAKDARLLVHYISIIKKLSPDIVLTYTIKPNIYGGIACMITGTPYITNVTGLGTAVESKGLLNKIVLNLYKIALVKSECVFFQNDSNRRFFYVNKIFKGKSRLIPGSGVNLAEHLFEEYPVEGIMKFLFIGRIMKEKGIY